MLAFWGIIFVYVGEPIIKYISEPGKFQEWLAITCFARIPSIFTSAIGGHAIGGAKYLTALNVFAITAPISIVGLIIFNKINDKEMKH